MKIIINPQWDNLTDATYPCRLWGRKERWLTITEATLVIKRRSGDTCVAQNINLEYERKRTSDAIKDNDFFPHLCEFTVIVLGHCWRGRKYNKMHYSSIIEPRSSLSILPFSNIRKTCAIDIMIQTRIFEKTLIII